MEINKRKFKKIPMRYLIAMLITILEIVLIIGVVVLSCYYIPQFYIFALITQFLCVLKIISSDDNPDYKVPWLAVVMGLPVIGFMLYFIFSSRKLKSKYVKKLKNLYKNAYFKDDENEFSLLRQQDKEAYNQFKMLSKISGAKLFNDTNLEYFSDINALNKKLLLDLENAKDFIFLEFFIIEKGEFFDNILKVLSKKAIDGVDVRIVFDDIGCMRTLPSNYSKMLKKVNITALPFSRLKGSADSEFNNRNHRKMIIIDGKIAYTGGFNLADEYLNLIERFGYWKDSGLRLEGNAVWEFTKLFTIDYGINEKEKKALPEVLYPKNEIHNESGFIMPFGDGPKPLYKRRVAKSTIQNLVASAKDYVYITTPYLIIDNDLLTDIENASLRGVDVKIFTPSIPDKKLVNLMTKSYYHRLMTAGVKIYEYTPGFLHAKTYLVDDKYALLGTINLDYRSLVHHFENGVLIYKLNVIEEVKLDVEDVLKNSKLIEKNDLKSGVFRRFLSSILRFFAPLM